MVTKIQDLDVSDYQKMVLSFIGNQNRTSYQIAAKLKKSYSSVNQTLGILQALGYVKKNKSMSGKCFYILDKSVEV